MYLHHILTREDDHLISRVFSAQMSDPSKNDWCNQISDDLAEFGLDYLGFSDIREMKKYKFKKLVKETLINTVINYLESIKGSKTTNIKSDNLDIQTYLKSKKLTLNEKKRNV